MRLYIGNISEQLAAEPARLELRVAKVAGEVAGFTVVLRLGLAFAHADIDDGVFAKVKGLLHGAMFMGSKLVVDRAKADWQERWKQDHDRKDEKEKDRRRRERIHRLRLERLKERAAGYPVNSVTGESVGRVWGNGYHMSAHTLNEMGGNTKVLPPTVDLQGDKSYGCLTLSRKPGQQRYSSTSGGGCVVNGRERKSVRDAKKLRAATLRVLINGEARVVKAYKTKLWGYEKKRTRDLVVGYQGGKWVDGNGHIVESVGTGARVSVGAGVGEESGDVVQESGEEVNEMDHNKALLASFFSSHDFEAPADVDVREEYASSDYEFEGGVGEGERGSGDVERGEIDVSVVDRYKKESGAKPFVHFDETDGEEQGEQGEQGEEPQTEQEQEQPATAKTEHPTNSTSHLRSLLNPDAATAPTFLFAIDDDIEEEPEVDAEEIHRQIAEKVEPSTRPRAGLFFPHFDLPFLQAQSAVLRMSGASVFDKESYAKTFWEQRGDTMAECRRRRRDVTRQFGRKK